MRKHLLPTLIFIVSLMVTMHANAQQAAPAMRSMEAEQVITGQIEAFKSGNHNRAFGYAAPSVKGLFGNTQRFIGMVKSGYGMIYGAQSWRYNRAQVTRDTILQAVDLVGPDGREWVALYTLRKQADGSWRIAAVQIKRANSLST